jgi:hypothetical protein
MLATLNAFGNCTAAIWLQDVGIEAGVRGYGCLLTDWPPRPAYDPFLSVTGGSFRDAKLLYALRPRSMRLARLA